MMQFFCKYLTYERNLKNDKFERGSNSIQIEI